jgi:hypothetical protein
LSEHADGKMVSVYHPEVVDEQVGSYLLLMGRRIIKMKKNCADFLVDYISFNNRLLKR